MTGGILRRAPAVCVALLTVIGGGCHKRERPEASLARSHQAFLSGQIASLKELIRKAEDSEIVTRDQIAIGISEDVVKTLLHASVPQETVVGGRLRVRVESAQPAFQGNRAGVLFRARAASVDAPGAFATIDLGGVLEQFKFEGGKLLARVTLAHFAVVESSVGALGATVLESLVRKNLGLIQESIPVVEIPVQLEQAIRIGGLTEGAVVAKPGVLPLEISVEQVIPVNKRLWILMAAKAGPWRVETAAAAE